MANTQQHTHTETAPAPAPAPIPNGHDADNAAWCKAAETRKYRVSDGVVYGYGSGLIVPLPAPAGFAGIEPLVQPFMFQAWAQMMMNRVVQNGEGNVIETVAELTANGKGTPNAQSNDAFDSCYYDYIEALIEAKVGKIDSNLKGDALKKARSDRADIVEAHLKPYSEKYFALSVKEALARAKSVATTEKKRTPKATSNVAVLDL